jgi:predicted signal transduction protein with EAL and GGDEF domain
MTGLLNRRQFYAITDPNNLNNRPAQQQFSLLLVDTDHFKNINDLFGHLKGDEVLIASPERWKPVVGRTTWCSAGGRRVRHPAAHTSRHRVADCRVDPCSRCPHYDSGLTTVYRQHWRGAT